MKKTAAVAALVVALAVSGCSSAAAEPQPSPTTATPQIEETAMPTTQPTPVPIQQDTAPSTAPTQSPEEVAIAYVQNTWNGDPKPTPEQISAAFVIACEQIAAGATNGEVTGVVEGSADDAFNSAIIAAAARNVC